MGVNISISGSSQLNMTLSTLDKLTGSIFIGGGGELAMWWTGEWVVSK